MFDTSNHATAEEAEQVAEPNVEKPPIKKAKKRFLRALALVLLGGIIVTGWSVGRAISAPTNDPLKLISRVEYIAGLRFKGLSVVENEDGSLTILAKKSR